MVAKLMKMECITNLHAGNGDVNYNIIDNEVERDPVTGYPTVNSSGIKGAFREFFEKRGIEKDTITTLFGGNDEGGNRKTIPGTIKFMQADLLAMPVRTSMGREPFYLVAPKAGIEMLQNKIAMIEDKEVEWKVENVDNDLKLAVETIPLKRKITIDEKTVYILNKTEFDKLALPVIARNKLDNGKSTNLWYEEVVPHNSIFTFYVLSDEEERLSQFLNVVNGQVVQFGGNATIGYGFCKVSVF